MAQNSHNHVQFNNLLLTDYNYRKLSQQHEQIEHNIEVERLHPGRAKGTIAELKKLKLRIRDEMTMIERAVAQRMH